MKEIAVVKVDGPEAKGNAVITQAEDGTLKLVSTDMWIAPGAPDVHVVISPNNAGQIDGLEHALGLYDYGMGLFEYAIPKEVELSKMKTVIVYCKMYTVHFGHGTIVAR